MKLKIKVKLLNGQKMPQVINKGEWIDLRSNVTVTLMPKSGVSYIPLGVAMKLPDGFEAIVAPRSSTPNKFGFIQPNSIGVIDNSYSGNEDEWKMIAYPIKKGTIDRFDRICQFRIQLSQKATFIQKLKWFFSNGVELVKVDDLNGPSRGGFGTTGKQ